ncbi:MAG: F0F1 ATP synthase subunit B [Patescibacteria group bacterium]
MDLISKLGIDWRLFLAQVINFIILLLVLNHFLYQPILNLLRSREEKIKKSLEDSGRIEEELLKIAKEREESLKKARIEAKEIIQIATVSASAQKEEILSVAKLEAEAILAKAQKQNISMASKIRNDILSDLSDLVISITEQVLAKKITKDSDREMIKQSLESLINK